MAPTASINTLAHAPARTPAATACTPTPTRPPPPTCTTPSAQVEARLRQLEGKQLGGESAKPRGLPGAEKYEGARAAGGGGGALLAGGKAYNADADVAATEADGKKEKKKVRAGRGSEGAWGRHVAACKCARGESLLVVHAHPTSSSPSPHPHSTHPPTSRRRRRRRRRRSRQRPTAARRRRRRRCAGAGCGVARRALPTLPTAPPGRPHGRAAAHALPLVSPPVPATHRRSGMRRTAVRRMRLLRARRRRRRRRRRTREAGPDSLPDSLPAAPPCRSSPPFTPSDARHASPLGAAFDCVTIERAKKGWCGCDGGG